MSQDLVVHQTIKQRTRDTAVKLIEKYYTQEVYKKGVLSVEAINNDIGILLSEIRRLRETK